MALSYFVQEGFVEIPHVINKFWTHKFDDDHFLVTTEHGAWVALNKEEFDLLRTDNITQDLNLFTALEEKGVVLTEKNQDRITQMYRERFHYLFNGINLHIVVPTLRCNQSCFYCQANSVSLSKKGFDMDEDTAKAVVDFIFQSPSKSFTIEFQGGEPLINFPIIEFIVQYAKEKNESSTCEDGWWKGKKNITFKIVSNFTLLDGDKLDFIIENSIELNTSLDGPKKLHDKNRPFTNGSSYNKVIYWIKEIKNRQYKFFSAALPTITKYSFPYAKEIVDEYLKHGFSSCWMRPLGIGGRAIDNWGKIGYTSEEFFDFWKNYLEYVLKINRKGMNFSDKTCVDFLRRIVTLKPPFNSCLGAPCGACTIQAAYNQFGDVYTCDEARANDVFKLGNVKGGGYKKIFTSNPALNFIGLTSMTTSFCDVCEWHPYCSPCLVSSYGSQGNLISKVPNDFLCKIRKKQTELIFRKMIFSEDKKILFNWISKSGS